MSFLYSVFPVELAAIDSGDTWEGTITELNGGGEQRNIAWSDSKREFDAATAEHLTLATLNTIRKHFNAVRGAVGYSFPLRDRTFYQATVEPLGVGDGSTTTFQLTKNDGNSDNSYNREIYLPESGTISIFDNATPVVEGAGAGKFTVPYSGATSGLVTFGTAPVTGHVLTWTGRFYLPVRYATKRFPGMKLFIWDSVTGVGLAQGAQIPLLEVRYANEVA